MGSLIILVRRLKLGAADVAIIAVLVVAGLNVLAEVWAWLSAPP